jgi:DNA processing protein
VLKTEHVALLAALNDDGQCRRGNACVKLRELPSDRVGSLLETYINKKRDVNMLLRINPALELVMRRGPQEDSLAKYLNVIRAYIDRNVRIITFWDDSYPRILRNIPDPPLILYVKGKVFPGNNGIAIVGTRVASERGRELSRKFARVLAEEGHTIVSGLASGIDTAAHEGALEGGGSTIAVLAGDVDNIYPNENVELARRIIEQGSIVSEITPRVEMRRGRFVERNRITSGLSEAVVIIETGKSGGTIRQAEYAQSQKRPTYVVDHGRFDRPESEEGFQHLVRSGAIPIRHPAELSELISH